MRPVIVAVVLGMLAASAHADEPWYRGKYGRSRVAHVSVTAAGGVIYLSSETVLKSTFGTLQCRWCNPDALDASIRNALVWRDTSAANIVSDLTGYVAAPIAGIGLVIVGSGIAHDELTSGQVIDDVLPIVETVVVSELILEVAKFIAERERPFAHYGDGAHDPEDNLSFMSGHAELAFGIATSAGMIAHRRHYVTEPYIWIIGMALAASTSYLRIAADKHYFTDAVGGGAVGVAAGLTVPHLMDRPDDLTVVPTGNGLAIAGAF